MINSTYWYEKRTTSDPLLSGLTRKLTPKEFLAGVGDYGRWSR